MKIAIYKLIYRASRAGILRKIGVVVFLTTFLFSGLLGAIVPPAIPHTETPKARAATYQFSPTSSSVVSGNDSCQSETSKSHRIAW